MRVLWMLMCCTAGGTALGKASETIYAQELVNRMVSIHADVAAIVMHVTPPKGAENVIIASNIGRIGKKADADDLKVIQTGKPNLAVNKSGDRYEVELVLKDANSRSIGALGIVFPFKASDDRGALQKRAEAIRDEFARRISHRANLMEPAQYDTSIPTRSYAQSLVDKALKRHPSVVMLAFHAKPSRSPDNVIVASNIGRIGKKADEDDLHVITSGETKLELNETGDRYEVEQTLADVSGTTIGAVGVVFAYSKGQDTAPLQSEAKSVRTELSRRISNVDNLLQPYPFDPRYPPDTCGQEPMEGGRDKQALKVRAEKIRDELAPRIASAGALFASARDSASRQ